jgi:hypothetical protein
MVSLIQTTIATVLGPLVGQLDAQRQTIDHQAEQLASQAGTISRLDAEWGGRARGEIVAGGLRRPEMTAAPQAIGPRPMSGLSTVAAGPAGGRRRGRVAGRATVNRRREITVDLLIVSGGVVAVVILVWVVTGTRRG